MLQLLKENLHAKFGFDTAEKEPRQVCRMITAREPHLESFLALLYDRQGFYRDPPQLCRRNIRCNLSLSIKNVFTPRRRYSTMTAKDFNSAQQPAMQFAAGCTHASRIEREPGDRLSASLWNADHAALSWPLLSRAPGDVCFEAALQFSQSVGLPPRPGLPALQPEACRFSSRSSICTNVFGGIVTSCHR